MRTVAPNSWEAGLKCCGPLLAIAMALSVPSPGASFAEQSGTVEIPLPPVRIIKSLIHSSDERQDRNRAGVTADIAQTCLEPEDQRVCEMELELGEVTIPH